MGFKGPNTQNAISVGIPQVMRENEIETMLLLVTVHIECYKRIAACFTAKDFSISAIWHLKSVCNGGRNAQV